MAGKPRSRVEMIGQRFGRVVVIEFAFIKNSKRYWKCQCDCGSACFMATGTLRSRPNTSCGCRQREAAKRTQTTHGKSKTPEYRVWKNMLTRCLNPNHMFWHRYGGRGISVCARWRRSFDAFIGDMGLRPSPSHTIDRIDNDGNYEPGNCRWVTLKENTLHTSKSRPLTFNGETHSIGDWATRLKMSRNTISVRLKQGLPIEEVLRPSTNGGDRRKR